MMSSSVPKIIIPGMTKLEQLDLEEALQEEDVEFGEQQLPAGASGEFLTVVAVVTLSALAIKTLAVWLAKNRASDNQIDEWLEIEYPDGTRVRRHIKTSSKKASELPAAAE